MTTVASYGDFSYQLSSSAKQAIAAMGTTEGLYTGVWIVSLNRGWNRLNADEYAKQVSLCMWGEHAQSRFWSYNSGTDAYDAQTNYQYLLERFMSGGTRNPLSRPEIRNSGNDWEASNGQKPLQTFAGIATWIPERSSIFGNLPLRHTSISATATATHTRERRLQVHGTTCLTRTTFRHTVGSLLSRAQRLLTTTSTPASHTTTSISAVPAFSSPVRLHQGAQHGILSLFEHTGKVGIHQNVLVEVIKFVTSREIDILGHPYGCHVVGNVQPEAFGLCEHNHIRSLLSRQREVSPYGDDAGFVVFSVFLFHDACFLPVVRSFAVALNAEIRPARPLFLGQQRSPFD